MTLTYYLSYDFGMKGDYEGLYKWLDSQNAEERGYGLAIIKKFVLPKDLLETEDKDKSFFDFIKKEVKKSVNISSSDRIYIMWKSLKNDKIIGGFIVGNSKQAPWVGFAYKESDTLDIG